MGIWDKIVSFFVTDEPKSVYEPTIAQLGIRAYHRNYYRKNRAKLRARQREYYHKKKAK